MWLADLDWLYLFRIAMFIGTWAIFPLNLWTYYKVMRQLQSWRDAEDARVIRWRADLTTAAKILTEAQDLRHQAEVSLALARRASMNGTSMTPK